MSARKAAGRGRPLAQNRRVRHDFHVLETVEAGLVLHGTEVKSIKAGQVQLRDAYVEFTDGEAWLTKLHVSPYSHGNIQNHDPERRRKLLLSRREIDRLHGRTQTKGLSVVPIDLHLSDGWVKAELALVQGKRQHDKRRAERERELDREVREAMKTPRRD